MNLFSPKTADLAPSRAFAMTCMGVKGEGNAEIAALLARAQIEVEQAAKPQVCFETFPLSFTETGVKLGQIDLESRSLAKALDGYTQAVLFAATLGSEIDRLIAARSVTSASLALAIDAWANATIEAVCDAFCDRLSSEYGALSMRFSPGYGDLSLSVQPTLLSCLGAGSRIGIRLTQGGMMVPVKSVVAVVGFH